MKWISLIVWAALSAADFIVWRRMVASRCDRRFTSLFAVAVLVLDLSPHFFSLLGWLLPDYSLWFVRAAMWNYTIYIILLFLRGTFYLFLPFARSRRMIVAGALAAVAVTCVPVAGLLSGRKRIETRRVTIRSERLPDGFHGFRVLQFSDLHVGTMLDPEAETAAVVEAINYEKPDLVIFSGDIVSIRYDEITDRIAELLSGIEAPVWSSVGNHDIGIYVKDTVSLPAEVNRRMILDIERSTGWNIIDDESVWLHRNGDSITLSGVSFPEEYYDVRHDSELPETDLSAVYGDISADPFNITVCHLPQLWDEIVDFGYGDLTLAGHYHGSQAGIRLFGRRWSPAQLIHREWSGLYERDGHLLYINDGIGYVSMFMRIGMPPEITVFTFEK